MPSNLIIFDAEYISELTSLMNQACELVDEAVSSLKQASLHEGWKCKECTKISESLDDLNLRLGRLDQGVNETVRVLGNSVSRFAELESQYENQANNLSEELRENYGYSASVHESSVSSVGQSAGAGTAAAAAGVGAKAENVAGGAASAGGARMPQVNLAGVKMPGAGGNVNINNEINNVNLPVTHIPDRPDDMATGIKDTEEISEVAVASVADTMIQVLGGNVSVRVVGPDGSDKTVERLVETFNAGKSIVENSASIISDSSLPHTEERIAMAAGIASLAGSAVTGLGMMKGAGEATPSIQDLGKRAEDLLPSVQDNELKSVLGAISAAGGASSAASASEAKSKSSFWDEILEGNETVNNFVENFMGVKGGSSGSRSSLGSVGSVAGSASAGGVSLAGLSSASGTGTSSSGKSRKSFLERLLEALLADIKEDSSSSSSSSLSDSSPIQTFLSSFVSDVG